MTQPVRTFVAKPEDMSSILGTYVVGGGSPACCPLTSTVARVEVSRTHTHIPHRIKTNVNNRAQPNKTRLRMKNVKRRLTLSMAEREEATRDTHREIPGPLSGIPIG